jgi:hypothetical protein
MRRNSLAVYSLLLMVLWHAIAVAAVPMTTIQIFGRTIVRAQLLTNVAAINDGEWIDVSGLNQLSLDIRGITSATVQLRGSNEPTKPLDSTHGNQLGSDTTVDGFVIVSASVRWMKLRVSTYVSGTINAYLEARAS